MVTTNDLSGLHDNRAWQSHRDRTLGDLLAHDDDWPQAYIAAERGRTIFAAERVG